MSTRYGVFLVPDAVTSAAVTAVTGSIRAQYGLVSAGAFPPHATLVGSLPIACRESELLEALDQALSGVVAVRVQNAGVRELGEVVVYDVSELDGAVNTGLRDLARVVDATVRPLLASTTGFPPDVYIEDRFHPHLSLASHDLWARPELLAEVARFARALPVAYSSEFLGDTVAAYRFEHPTWEGRWWEVLRWTHVRSWRLREPGEPPVRPSTSG
jgi:hypothetical protein